MMTSIQDLVADENGNVSNKVSKLRGRLPLSRRQDNIIVVKTSEKKNHVSFKPRASKPVQRKTNMILIFVGLKELLLSVE